MKTIRLLSSLRPMFSCVNHKLHISSTRQFSVKSTHQFSDYFKYSQEVREALVAKRPVVALESTIITHGMPYPENLQTAIEVEDVVRDNGATPATIAVIEGNIHIGLTDRGMNKLAKGEGRIIKTSRRDLSYVISQGLSGGTTVSGTTIIAHKAGIPIFVTGGIGGVHRGGQKSMDISADLTELGRTPVCVVSAGVKSILDIPRTLEYLETQGVSVVTYDSTPTFPAFFTRDSGVQSPYHVTTSYQAAQLVDAMISLNLRSGMLLAVPIPEGHAADGQQIEEAIQVAVTEADEKLIHGKEVTPYILQRVNEITMGRSLEANIGLIKNNAKVGAEIACHLTQIMNQSERKNTTELTQIHQSQSKGTHILNQSTSNGEISEVKDKFNKLVVIGGINVDFTCAFKVKDIILNGGTYPGTVQQSFGGVGRNIADCLTRLGVNTLLLSAVGRDIYAENLEYNCKHMEFTNIRRSDKNSTACYSAILKSTGELMYGIGDFDIHDEITRDYVSRYESDLCQAPLVFIDGNIPPETMAYVCDVCEQNGVPVWFDPTDIRKGYKIFESDCWKKLTYISPNLNELRELHQRLGQVTDIKFTPDPVLTDVLSNLSDVPGDLRESIQLVQPILQYIPNILVTLGNNGLLLCRNTDVETAFPLKGNHLVTSDGVSVVHYPVTKPGKEDVSIVSVSGAGDCLSAAVIWNILGNNKPHDCMTAGLLAAQLSLTSHMAIPTTLRPEALTKANVEKWVEEHCVVKEIYRRKLTSA